MSFTSILFQQTIRNYLDIFTITICYIKIFLATSNIVHSGYCGLAKSRLLILLKHRCWNKVHGCRAKSQAHEYLHVNFLLNSSLFSGLCAYIMWFLYLIIWKNSKVIPQTAHVLFSWSTSALCFSIVVTDVNVIPHPSHTEKS